MLRLSKTVSAVHGVLLPGQKLEHVEDEEETRKRGFLKGGSFKLLKRDIVLLTEEQWRVIQQQVIRKSEESYLQVKDD